MVDQTAVVFGAGKMACGLLGRLLTESGCRVIFVARRPEVVSAINQAGGYRLTITGRSVARVTVRQCRAVATHDRDGVVDALASADVAFTAVGIDNLTAITPLLAAGLWERSARGATAPLNVVACENLPGAGAYLRHQVVNAAAPEQRVAVERAGGFTAGLTRRIMTGGTVEGGALSFAVDGAGATEDLVVDAAGLAGTLPPLRGVGVTHEFAAMVQRKLFTLNCAQAVAAYLGFQEGCRYVHEAAAHPRVAPVVRGALAEAQAALTAELPHHAAGIERDVAEALERIADASLGDTVSRVARGPRRKLSPRERLVGPARLAARHGLPHEYLAQSVAAALAYDDREDPQAMAMRQAIQSEGLEAVLTDDCGLLPHEDLARLVKREWRRLSSTSRAFSAETARVPWSPEAPVPLESLLRSLVTDLSQRFGSPQVKETLVRVTADLLNAPLTGLWTPERRATA